MQEYKSLLGTDLSEGLIESNFKVAIDQYASSHIIVVTVAFFVLRQTPSSVLSLLFLFLSHSVSSFFHSVSSFWRIHRYYFSMRSFVFLGGGFDLALATEGFFARNDRPTPDFLLGMCRSSIGHFLHVKVGTNIKESQVIRHGNVRRKLRGKTETPVSIT